MSATPLVSVDDLWIDAARDGERPAPIVKGVSFELMRGEVLALIGESGSGKTTIALSLLGYARRGCRISRGRVSVAGTRVEQASDRALQALRGGRVAYVAQSAASAFNPARTVESQLLEAARKHGNKDKRAVRDKIASLCRAMALPEPAKIATKYPFQLSGGQLQRLMIVMALINDPELIVLDEPTTALDVSTQVEVLRCIKRAIAELHISAVYVSHDLAVVAQVADRVVVLNGGEVKEAGAIADILSMPQHEYTRSLLDAAAPRESESSLHTSGVARDIVLEVERVSARHGNQSEQYALRDVSLQVRRGEALGVIGESGSGKTTLASAIAGLIAPVQGRVMLNGKPMSGLASERSRDELRRVQMVFQNPESVLNPKQSVAEILSRPLAVFHCRPASTHAADVARLLDQVKLPAQIARRYPWELSGGQRQRVNLARALAAEPDVLLCDEVTSALDTVVGAAILDLLLELRRELGLAYLFISHDLATVRSVCDRVMVFRLGQQTEECVASTLREDARDPYTKQLLTAVPELRIGWLEEQLANGGG